MNTLKAVYATNLVPSLQAILNFCHPSSLDYKTYHRLPANLMYNNLEFHKCLYLIFHGLWRPRIVREGSKEEEEGEEEEGKCLQFLPTMQSLSQPQVEAAKEAAQ